MMTGSAAVVKPLTLIFFASPASRIAGNWLHSCSACAPIYLRMLTLTICCIYEIIYHLSAVCLLHPDLIALRKFLTAALHERLNKTLCLFPLPPFRQDSPPSHQIDVFCLFFLPHTSKLRHGALSHSMAAYCSLNFI